MVEMNVFGLTIDPQTKTPIVMLREVDGETILPVWVGAMEAMAVSLVLNKENLPRPLTHDLLLMTLRALKASLTRVEITDLKDGVFFALLVLQGPDGRVRVDCRPSDAIALAMEALTQANTVLQTRFSPALGAETARIFSALTAGRYDKVLLDRNLSLSAQPAGDAVPRALALLSQGAGDQLYLAARLAI